MEFVKFISILAILVHNLNSCIVEIPCSLENPTYTTEVPSSTYFTLQLNDPVNNRASGRIIVDKTIGYFGVALIDGDLKSGFKIDLQASSLYSSDFFTSFNHDYWYIKCLVQENGQTTIGFEMPICDSMTNNIPFGLNTRLEVYTDNKVEQFKIDAISIIIAKGRC